MSLSRPIKRSKGEPTIGLINVVFLMLIFFLIAGTLAPAPGEGIALVDLGDTPLQPPPDALVLTAEGRLLQGGAETDAARYLATLTEPRVARILPDRRAQASTLVTLAAALTEGGAARVVILGERGVR